MRFRHRPSDRRLPLAWLLTLGLLSPRPGLAQEGPVGSDEEPPPGFGQASVQLLRDLGDDGSGMLRRADTYLILGSLIVAPQFLKHEGTGLNDRLAASPDADRILESGEFLGNAIVPVGLSLATWGLGTWSGSKDRTRLGSELFRAQVLTGAFTLIAKTVSGRDRPDGSSYSFPSGHTSSAFAFAGVIARRKGLGWGLLAEAGAVLVGLSRMQENRHYASDVIAGALLGTWVAFRVTAPEREDQPSIEIMPLAAGGIGLQATVRF